MNLCSEYCALSKHLMLFLIAVFAFTAKPLLEGKEVATIGLYAAALTFAILSFLAGYATLFRIYNDEHENPSIDEKRCVPAKGAKTRLQAQYMLTIISLLLVVSALLQQLLAKAAAG